MKRDPVQVVEGIEVFRGAAPRPLRRLLYEGHRRWKQWLGSTRIPSLEEGLRRFKRPSEAAYFIGREGNPTQARARELAARWLKGRILDLGCGVGHLLRDLGPEAAGLDSSFANLWLARRFVVPKARLLCADLAAGIPLGDGEADGVCCVEAFAYMPGREALAREILRVWNRRSSLVLSHVHRKPAPPGTPASPEELRALFPGARIEEEPAETFTVIVAGT